MYLNLLLLLLLTLAHSTLYSVNADFEVSFETSYSELAHATYEERIYEKGWNYLHIYASPHKNLVDQHRGAGFLEGYTTYR